MSLQYFQRFTSPPCVPMAPDGLSKEDAGRLIQRRRVEAGLTQDQLADQVGVDKSYISKLEGGVHGVRASKYLQGLAQALKLTENDIRAINPSAIFNLETEAKPISTPPAAQPVELPDELLEAVSLYGKRFPDLTDPKWQQFLASFRARGMEGDSPEDWLDLYRNMARHGIQPERKD